MFKMRISYILNDNNAEDCLLKSSNLSQPQFLRVSQFEESAEVSKHTNMTRSHSETLKCLSSPRLSDSGTVPVDSKEEPPLSSSGQFSHCASRNNRRLRYMRMISEEMVEESRLQERLTWLIRRIGMQKASHVLNERLKDRIPVIEGSAKETVILERPRRRETRIGIVLSQEQRASRRNMQKRESKRRLFKYYQDQLNAVRQNMLKLREATRICETLLDQMIERNFENLTRSDKVFSTTEYTQGPSSLTPNTVHSEVKTKEEDQRNHKATWES